MLNYIIVYYVILYYIKLFKRLDLNSCVELPIQFSTFNNFRIFFCGDQSCTDSTTVNTVNLKNNTTDDLIFVQKIYNIDIILIIL